jgi:hypothetical protein
MKYLLAILLAASAFAEPIVIVTKQNVTALRQMGAPVPPGMSDHLQVLVKSPDSDGRRFDVTLRYVERGEEVIVKRMTRANAVGAFVLVFVKSAADVTEASATAEDMGKGN